MLDTLQPLGRELVACRAGMAAATAAAVAVLAQQRPRWWLPPGPPPCASPMCTSWSQAAELLETCDMGCFNGARNVGTPAAP